MKVLGIFSAFVLALVVQTSALGSNCGADSYFKQAAFSVSPSPVRGKWSLLTLTGVTPFVVYLQEWDLFLNLNGNLVYMYDVPLTGAYSANTQVSVSYNFTIPANTEPGYYSLRLLLQNNQNYYINCWIYNYFISG
jgi:hypothetical protein